MTTTIHLRFLSPSVLNSQVVDSTSGEVLYEVVTKGISGSSDIRLRTVLRDGRVGQHAEALVAVWERAHGSERGEDWITYHSATSEDGGVLSDWLPELVRFPPATQPFVSPTTTKEQYLWQRRKHKKGFKLIDPGTQTVLASSTRASGLALRPARPGLCLDVHQPARLASILDAVLLSFVILEQLRWEEEVTTVGAADGLDAMLSGLGRGLRKMLFKAGGTRSETETGPARA